MRRALGGIAGLAFLFVSSPALAHGQSGEYAGFAGAAFIPAAFVALVVWLVPWFFSANMSNHSAKAAVRWVGGGFAAVIMVLWGLFALACLQ